MIHAVTLRRQEIVFDVLKKAAAAGERTPNDYELGEACGLKKVPEYIRRLKDAGLIVVTKAPGGGRVVTIVSTGDSTKSCKNIGPMTKKPRPQAHAVPTPRRCLRCGDEFKSVHPPAVHRICNSCRQSINNNGILDGALGIPIGPGHRWRKTTGGAA